MENETPCINAERRYIKADDSTCNALFKFLHENGFTPKEAHRRDAYEVHNRNGCRYLALTTSYGRHKGLIETILARFFPTLTTSDIDVYEPGDGLSNELVYVIPIGKESFVQSEIPAKTDTGKAPNKTREPKVGEDYFFIKPVVVKKTAYPPIDPPHTRVVYKTEQEAREAAEEMVIRELFKHRSIEAGEPENKWAPSNYHWYVYFSKSDGLAYRCVSCAYIDGTIYFPTRETLHAAVQELGADNIKRYLLNVKE